MSENTDDENVISLVEVFKQYKNYEKSKYKLLKNNNQKIEQENDTLKKLEFYLSDEFRQKLIKKEEALSDLYKEYNLVTEELDEYMALSNERSKLEKENEIQTLFFKLNNVDTKDEIKKLILEARGYLETLDNYKSKVIMLRNIKFDNDFAEIKTCNIAGCGNVANFLIKQCEHYICRHCKTDKYCAVCDCEVFEYEPIEDISVTKRKSESFDTETECKRRKLM